MKSTGVVVILFDPLFKGHVRVVLVVAVVADDGDRAAEVVLEMLCQRGLAAAGAAGDADEKRIHWETSPTRFCGVARLPPRK